MYGKTKLFLASTLLALAGALQIDTPASLIECQPTSITFSGGSSSPYYIAVLPGGEVSATAYENLPSVTASPVTWTVDLAAGTNVTLKITDGSGNNAYTSAVVIQSGSSTSCLNSTSSATSSSGSSATSGSGSSATSASGSATSGSSSSSASASSSSGAANMNVASGAVGLLGLAAAAVGIMA